MTTYLVEKLYLNALRALTTYLEIMTMVYLQAHNTYFSMYIMTFETRNHLQLKTTYYQCKPLQ